MPRRCSKTLDQALVVGVEPIQNQTIVSPSRTPRALYERLMRRE